jgi:hypothetical protein
MNTNSVPGISSLALFCSLLFLFSCNDDDRITIQDKNDITEEALTDSYFQDLDDMAGAAIAAPGDDEFSGRKSSHIEFDDQRFQCSGAVIELARADGSTPEHPMGVITVDFGTGCTDQRGNIRTGKLTFTYNGRRFQQGATVVVTPDNYTINGTKLEGVRTMTNVTGSTAESPRFNVVLTDGKATFEDNSVAERESNITWSWERSPAPADNKLVIHQGSEASGKTRGGRTYTMAIINDVKYKRFCGIAVEGIKQFVINSNKEVTIDYGDGTCDRSIDVTVSGDSRRMEVGN